MKTKHWIKRILVSLMIFCLAGTGLGVQPAQASPPVDDDLPNFTLKVKFDPAPAKVICLKTKTKIRYSISIDQEGGKSYRTTPFKNAEVSISAERGKVRPMQSYINDLMIMKTEWYEFEYTAVKEDSDTVTVKVYVPGAGIKTIDAPFEVKLCESYNIRGSTDIGSVVNAMNSSNNSWDFVGSYDIVGTVKANDDGTLSGQGTANLFADAIFIGGDSDVTCEHITPWQGNTTIEIGADPNAWANEGILDLQIRLDPMPINSTSVVCRSSTGGGSQSGPSFTFASYDLDFDTLPMEGGNTSLYFHFPDGTVEFQMDLIASPEEAES